MSFQKYLLHKKKKQLMTFDMNYEIIVQKNLLAHYVQTSLQTINDMLVYRNIQPNYLNKYSDIEISTIIDNDDLFVFQVNETTSIIYVLQMDQRTRKQISKITSNMKHVLFVIDDTFKRDTFSSYTADNVEIWNVNELMYNIARHNYVPKHEIVADVEVQDILNTYNITVHDLPGIRINDPMARYIGAKAGELVRIFRNSQNMGDTIVYRYCNSIVDDVDSDGDDSPYTV